MCFLFCSLVQSFRDLFVREGYQMDYVFDWTIKRMQETQDKNKHSGSSFTTGHGTLPPVNQ